MDWVVVQFETKADAYAFLSESRRLAASLLWEITVEQANEGWLLRVPSAFLSTGMADALDRYHGSVLAPDN